MVVGLRVLTDITAAAMVKNPEAHFREGEAALNERLGAVNAPMTSHNGVVVGGNDFGNPAARHQDFVVFPDPPILVDLGFEESPIGRMEVAGKNPKILFVVGQPVVKDNAGRGEDERHGRKEACGK